MAKYNRPSSFSRLTVINALIAQNQYTSYLELGCFNDYVFNNVKAKHKIGVDTISGGTFRGTTDEFFSQNTETFDIIFVDACHMYEFVLRDTINGFKILNKNGTIVMHDTNPWCKAYELPGACGDGWKAYVELRQRDDLEMICGDFDYGVGILRMGKQNPLILNKEPKDLVYEDLEVNRSNWLKLSNEEQITNFIQRR